MVLFNLRFREKSFFVLADNIYADFKSQGHLKRAFIATYRFRQ